MSDAIYDDPRFAEVETAIPHRRLEAWKWTDVRRALGARPDGLSKALTPEFHDAATNPRDVQIVELDAGEAHPMDVLFETFGVDAYEVRVPAGEDGGTLSVTSLERGNGAIRIVLGEGAKLSLVEHHEGEPGAFVNADLDIRLGKGAHLQRTVLQTDAANVVRIVTARIAMEAGAELEQYIYAEGSALSRFETRVTGAGSDIRVTANGAYLLDGKRHADLTTHIDLAAPDALIRQSVKGITTDKARGVFQGKFLVQRAAQHTDAEMRHDALMLSETATVRSKPELEIYADDVACAHGNTIGQLDESALFYMRQRGIPLEEARSLLIQAFLAEVFDGAEEQEILSGRVSAWLGAEL